MYLRVASVTHRDSGANSTLLEFRRSPPPRVTDTTDEGSASFTSSSDSVRQKFSKASSKMRKDRSSPLKPTNLSRIAGLTVLIATTLAIHPISAQNGISQQPKSAVEFRKAQPAVLPLTDPPKELLSIARDQDLTSREPTTLAKLLASASHTDTEIPTLPSIDLNIAMSVESQGQIQQSDSASASNNDPKLLLIDQNENKSLFIDGLIRNYNVHNSSICQATTIHKNRLVVMGINEGTTQLDILVELHPRGEPQVKSFKIKVCNPETPAASSLQRTVNILTNSIRSGFPGARVQMQINDGEIFVSGDCSSEKSARKILRIVRQTCTTPVWDQLIVR